MARIGCLAAAFAFGLAARARAVAQQPAITPEMLARHIHVLAHDSMRGRATPSPELEKAAAYVEEVFRGAGLGPAGDGGAYQQRFPLRPSAASGDPSAPNVVGLLGGRDPVLRGEYVVVVAHMDHLGIGRSERGDSIRNGADDNASGTAGVLALAAAFGRQVTRPRRSILFLVVSGEERGMLGSRYFVAHPTVPFERIVGLVNLDMISRNRPDSVFLNGWGKSTISGLVRRLAAEHPELGLGVGPDVQDRPQTPADSDHWPFQRRGVPYIFFYTGEHGDYHGPTDHAERTDPDKASRVTRLAFYTVWEMAESTERPQWGAEARRLNVSPR
ncbi:MAG: M20/M25/M40 family metallo-hydrolase [Gemmatimonadetes bacterium]|nr:M20/M25/M40 family metallo-hydrolase [Gemmatimonadota bacterium]